MNVNYRQEFDLIDPCVYCFYHVALTVVGGSISFQSNPAFEPVALTKTDYCKGMSGK